MLIQRTNHADTSLRLEKHERLGLHLVVSTLRPLQTNSLSLVTCGLNVGTVLCGQPDERETLPRSGRNTNRF